jgi:hypothetical protein
MGRHKILGQEKCPYPECGELGRKRQKSIRNRPTGRYVRYYWFRHNDSNIPEHYIDNLISPKDKEKSPNVQLAEEIFKIAHTINKISKRIMSFPLDKEQLDWLNRRLEWFIDNILFLHNMIADITTGRLEAPPGTSKKALCTILKENILSENNVFGRGYIPLYVIYDRPMRLERNKIRNKKLSKWDGPPLDDFSGIESKSINSELIP